MWIFLSIRFLSLLAFPFYVLVPIRVTILVAFALPLPPFLLIFVLPVLSVFFLLTRWRAGVVLISLRHALLSPHWSLILCLDLSFALSLSLSPSLYPPGQVLCTRTYCTSLRIYPKNFIFFISEYVLNCNGVHCSLRSLSNLGIFFLVVDFYEVFPVSMG